MAEGEERDPAGPLVGLGRGDSSEARREETAERPDARADEAVMPRWADTLWLVGCVALAQWMLLVAWSGAQLTEDASLRCYGCDQVLVTPMAAALGTWIAALAARECGAGRMGQLVVALALLGAPRVAWLASHADSFLPLVAPLAVWTQLRALRLRTTAAAALSAGCAVLLLASSPSSWPLAVALVASLASAGVPALLGAVPVGLLGLAGVSALPDGVIDVPAVGGDWLWRSPLALGLPLLLLAVSAALRMSTLSSWLRPFLASMITATAATLILEPTSEALYGGLLGLALLGAGGLGSRAEVRGRLAMSLLLGGTFAAALALVPLFVARLG